MRKIDFYFDFSSPYAYLASHQLDALSQKHDVEFVWRPFLLGAVFKVTGTAPLISIPLKSAYFQHDVRREARRIGVPFVFPAQFPFGTVTACRAFYHLQRDSEADAVTLAKAVFHRAFGEGQDTCPVEAITGIAAEAGFRADHIQQGVQDPAVRNHLRLVVDEAISRSVFGSPFFFVDNEPFWGNDRLSQIDQWLATGGW